MTVAKGRVEKGRQIERGRRNKLTPQAPELHVQQRCEPAGSFLSMPSA